MTPATTILLALAVPLVGAVLIAAAHWSPNVRETITMITAGLLFLLVVSLTPLVLAGERPVVTLFEIMPGLALRFEVEPLGMLFGLIASGLWIVNSLYSIGYMRANDERHQTRFYVCFAGALASAIGIAFAGNLLTLFVCYEALTLITYPLVTHAGTDEARRAGRVYLGLLVGTSIVFLLVAIIWTWHLTGTIDFKPGGMFHGKAGNATLGALLALYVFGIGKAALMPFHRWLPAAMVAPTPVSALLHAVAVVKAGVFTVVKVVVYVFGVNEIAGLASVQWLPFVAGVTIIAASIVALRSDNLKRRLAYSTVSQLSYVVLAVALLTPLSVIGAALHIAAHALGKITLFFAAGAIYTAAHKTEVSELDGIGRRMPWTMGAFAIGSLSIIGLPPVVGFVSKWYIVSGAMATGQWGAVAVLFAGTLLSAGYLLPIVYRAFFLPLASPGGHHPAHGEAPLTMVIAVSASAFGTVALFFYPDALLALSRQLAGHG
ncbi:MAG: monovalent cation/H+ antiporter subunit D family protein [Betaproteobacteria bacterium]|nr:monovalent cation/H+ antiporter subunit D family protein [Betaproteobacteria bacterium]MBI3057644.1 monovalent cation/H+ antiporter subunit D family protein [Betaproteobacteria bacterium]